MRVEVDVLGSPSLIVRTVSVDVTQHWNIAVGLRSCVTTLKRSRDGKAKLKRWCEDKTTLKRNDGERVKQH